MSEKDYNFDTSKFIMGVKMSDLKQKIIQFDYDVNFKEEDFFLFQKAINIF